MSKQKKGGRMGRPPFRTEPYKRTSLELPVRLLDVLVLKKNRGKWLVGAIEEKLEREQKESPK